MWRFEISEATTWPWSFEEDLARYAALGADAIETWECSLITAAKYWKRWSDSRLIFSIAFVTDPNISMFPPDIEKSEIQSFASTALAADPDEGRMIVQSLKEVFAGISPGKHGNAHETQKLAYSEQGSS